MTARCRQCLSVLTPTISGIPWTRAFSRSPNSTAFLSSEKLLALDTHSRARARLGRRAAVGSMVRTHAEEALAESDRLGRIIYFLRFRNFASSSTPKDQVLCNALAEKLTAKGQWTGEYSL